MISGFGIFQLSDDLFGQIAGRFDLLNDVTDEVEGHTDLLDSVTDEVDGRTDLVDGVTDEVDSHADLFDGLTGLLTEPSFNASRPGCLWAGTWVEEKYDAFATRLMYCRYN